MHGILIIDKPAGMTSHDVVARIRRIIRDVKVGHGGTLDPLATGVLPILVGRATRLSNQIMSGDKEYLAVMKFGETTDTDDADGSLVKTFLVPSDLAERLEAAVPHFVGVIKQVPPVYSAIKNRGRPLYKLARDGVNFKPQPREVEIKAIEIKEVIPPFATLWIKCSKGTYVRSIARDIGELISCGAHISSLRRFSCGKFHIGSAHKLDEISTLQDLIRMLCSI